MNAFEAHRRSLWAIADRMTGSAAEAEDIVQEAYLRAHDALQGPLESPRAYLVRVVTRLCLDHWKSARTRRESYPGIFLPEPVASEGEFDREALSLACLALLEKLTPTERVVYVLGEAFDYTHAELASLVGESEVSCRQLLHRARERMKRDRPRFSPSPEQHSLLVAGFVEACTRGDVVALERLLSADVIACSDSGGKSPAATQTILGRERVSRLYLGLFRKAPSGVSVRLREVNGSEAVVVELAQQLLCVIDLETDGQQIYGVRAFLNPDKLGAVARVVAREPVPP